MNWSTTHPTVTGQYVVNIKHNTSGKSENCAVEIFQENDEFRIRATNLELYVSNPLAEFNIHVPSPEFAVAFFGPLPVIETII